jgi:hypothetical protein
MQRPIGRLAVSHLPTLVATVAVAVGLAAANTALIEGITHGNSWSTTGSGAHGWPIPYYEYTITKSWAFNGGGKPSISTTDENWRVGYLWFDRVTALALLVATGTVCEMRRRSGQLWFQVSLRSLLSLIGVTCCFLALYRNEFNFYLWLSSDSSILTLFGSLRFRPWYIQGSVGLGIACLIYLVGWLAVSGVLRGARWLRRGVLST